MSRISCTKCGHEKSWKVRRGNRLCSRCGYEWNQKKKLPLRLTAKQWKEILKWFILGQSSNMISGLTAINRKRTLRSLTYARKAMKNDVPKQFSGIVEVDETYMGGKWINKPRRIRKMGTKSGKGTTKQPVFGIYARKGIVWAELVDDTKAKTLQPLIERQVKGGSTVFSDAWRGYTGIATRGYVHRLVDHKKEFVRKNVHINGLEGFWGYLKRRLAAKGGIRRERLDLYLAEYVWRYNNRKLSPDQQVKKLMKLLSNKELVTG
jgi:transposase